MHCWISYQHKVMHYVLQKYALELDFIKLEDTIKIECNIDELIS